MEKIHNHYEKLRYIKYLGRKSQIDKQLIFENGWCQIVIGSYQLTLIHVTKLAFSPNRPHWAELVIELPCPWGCVCMRHWVPFCSRPLIGPEVTSSVPGLSLVLPPSLLWKLGNLETWKLGNSETRKLGNSELGNSETPPNQKKVFGEKK